MATDKSSKSRRSTSVKPFETGKNEETKTPYPKSVIFIIGNEFCERFSFYGMKGILTLYFLNKLQLSAHTATETYHTFVMVCYFTPVIGAIIADSFLGKFKTIFSISIIYVAGNIVVAISSLSSMGITAMLTIGMIGLALIAFGTGGIKPCVAAFGADQFLPHQEKQRKRFFSFFYISINAGSLLSTIITPKLRGVHCMGGNDCYPLAFGVPAILMIVALILFVIGKPMYKILRPESNIIVEVVRCMCYAIKKKCQSKGEKRKTWLDYADDKYSRSLIEDIKPVLRVLKLYIPLPVFWALFEQQGSTWSLQAAQLDGAVTENFQVEPEQMLMFNALLVIMCVPLFEYVIYPAFAKIKWLVRPLQRMVAGGLLTAFAFVLAFFLQLALEKTLPSAPKWRHGQLHVLNEAPCSFDIYQPIENMTLHSQQFHVFRNVPAGDEIILQFNPVNCPPGIAKTDYKLKIENKKIETLMVSVVQNKLHFFKTNDTLNKPDNGFSNVRIFFNDPDSKVYNANSTFVLKQSAYTIEMPVVNLTADNVGSTNYVLLYPGRYTLFTPSTGNNTAENEKLRFRSGGNYIILISGTGSALKVSKHIVVEPNRISIFLQIPQYLVITFGEVMFSITGLEFSYSQAPECMKAVLQAGWLLTTAFGNLLVVIISQMNIGKQSTEFITFACLLAVVMGIFAVMAYFFKPLQKKEDSNVGNDKRN